MTVAIAPMTGEQLWACGVQPVYCTKNETGKWTPLVGTTGGAPFPSRSPAPRVPYRMAFRPPLDKWVMDVDQHPGKADGVATIEKLETEHGPLPPTWRLTSGGPNQRSGRYLYTIPTGLVIRDDPFTKAGGGVESIRTGHRFSWAPGDINPRTDTPVVCYDPNNQPCPLPHIDRWPWIGGPWEEFLSTFQSAVNGSTERGGGVRHITMREADRLVVEAWSDYYDTPRGSGARRLLLIAARTQAQHDQITGSPTDIEKLAAEHSGFDGELDSIAVQTIAGGVAYAEHHRWVLDDGRFFGFDTTAMGAALPSEMDTKQLTPSSAAVTTAALDESGFWSARPELTTVRDFALARRVSPWAVLGGVLVRTVCSVGAQVVLPPLRGDHASLNLFVALVGASGSGKSGALKVSGQAVIRYGGVPYAVFPLGSGQGIAHAYRRWDGTEKQVVTANESVLFRTDEVDHLAGNAAMNGSVLLPELRRLYMGEELGALYVDRTKRVPVPEHMYRAGLIVGVQPTRADVLLDDTDGGLPQRFLWLPTAYPHPDSRPVEPTPYLWREPRWATDPVAAPHDRPAMPVASRVTLSVCAIAEAQIDAAALADAKGQGDPLDGHRLLAKLKVAAALDILNSSAEVTEEAWQLADVVMTMSDWTRASVVDALHAKAQRSNLVKARFEADRAVLIGDQVEGAAQRRVSMNLARKLTCEWTNRGELRKTLPSRDRERFDAVMAELVDTGVAERSGVDGAERYRRQTSEG